MNFQRFVAVDWSGARPPRYDGIAVAECGPGSGPPVLVANPAGGRWRRSDVATWLAQCVKKDGPILAGFDFAFALPHGADSGYFPGSGLRLSGAPDLWRLVDRASADDPDLFAGGFLRDSRYRRHFWTGGKRRRFRERFRLTERRCRDLGLGTPECVFKLVGARQVGKGSLAGMRFLQCVKDRLDGATRVWPFEAPTVGRSALVEVFPRLFIAESGHKSGKIRDAGTLNRALAHYTSEPFSEASGEVNDHETDALVSAAALRRLSGDEDLWHPTAMTAEARRFEGWIFGVP